MADKDFFLSSDDAQTFGDINYMKRSVRVRHTFPKTLKNPNGFAVEKEVSSSDGRFVDGFTSDVNEISSSSAFQSVQNSNSSAEPIKSTPKKRPQGSSMDMFRNMARNIGKK
ncbi:hypothetical protein I4641_02125 [Waterburya agarophytonicola K14]|uniref:Uncharacterized protein n=1 Tax=Waterburya agarophytonicola KI4 TaxID=2874699 RepID=A0A964BN68_9CYAN|nr:hypothetical protein [Waterburya agarophytonicola]MCC0175777.1 hypothetical protein [Waterburya agarophytonicola KI4]